MSGARVRRVEVESFKLEVPSAAFEQLPKEIGCTLERSGVQLTLSSDRAKCQLRFVVLEDVASLESVEILDDPEAHFTLKVLGRLLLRYKGDFAGVIYWESPTEPPSRLTVREGRSAHGTGLAPAASASPADRAPDVVDQLLAEAARSWNEYQRLKAERTAQERRSS